MQSTHGTQPQSHAVMPTIVHGGNVMSGFGSSAPEKPAESAAGADLLVGSLQTPPVTRSGGHLACLKHAMATIRSSSTTTATTTAPTDIINNILKPPCNSFYREHDCHHRCRYTQHHRDQQRTTASWCAIVIATHLATVMSIRTFLCRPSPLRLETLCL